MKYVAVATNDKGVRTPLSIVECDSPREAWFLHVTRMVTHRLFKILTWWRRDGYRILDEVGNEHQPFRPQ